MVTKGETISRMRNLVKGDTQDAFLTDRLLYSMLLKYARLFIKRKDDQNKLSRYSSLFQNLPGIKLCTTSPIEAGCIGLDVCCVFKRTESLLPAILEGSWGPVIRAVTSIDGSKEVKKTDPKTYANITKSSTFKYNKYVYYWYRNGYLYFPNVEWDVVDIEAMWEDDITDFLCDAQDCCVDRREERTNIPDDLFPEIEQAVLQDILRIIQIPKENNVDNQSQLKN